MTTSSRAVKLRPRTTRSEEEEREMIGTSTAAGVTRKSNGAHVGRSGFRAFLGALPFITPSFFGVIMFLIIPVVVVFIISFMNWNLMTSPTWAGFRNYLNIFAFDDAAHSLGVTFYYVLLNIPLQTVVALGMAVMLNRKLPAMGLYRVLFVAPYLSTPVAMAVIWFWVFDPKLGAVNAALAHIGITGPQWLSDPSWAMPIVAFVNIWQYVGYNMLFFLAALQAIPNQVYDTLYVLTQGGPGNSTEVLNLKIYQVAFTDFRLGEAAAMSVLLFGVILVFSIGQYLFLQSRTTYEYSA